MVFEKGLEVHQYSMYIRKKVCWAYIPGHDVIKVLTNDAICTIKIVRMYLESSRIFFKFVL